jgi:hypothetical protein
VLGVAEHGVTPIRTYSEAEARAAGLIDADGALVEPAAPAKAGRTGTTLLRAPRADAPARAAGAKPAFSPSALIATLQRWTVRG